MKTYRLMIGACLVSVAAIGGCDTLSDMNSEIGVMLTEQPAPMGQWEAVMDEMVRNGAIHDQTLQGFDFRPNSPELSPLGRTRLERIVQTGHPEAPFVFVASSWEEPALSSARVEAVRQMLAHMGPGSKALTVKAIVSPRWDTAGDEAVFTVDTMLETLSTSRSASGTASSVSLTGTEAPPTN